MAAFYVSKQEIDAISKVAEYDYDEEKRSYDEWSNRYGKNNQPLDKGHIFYHVYRLKRLGERLMQSTAYQKALK